MRTLQIAFRNLNRQKRRTVLLGGAIAFGLFVITFLNALTGGVVQNLEKNYSRLLGGEVFIQGVVRTPDGRTKQLISDDQSLTAAVQAAGIPVLEMTRSSSFLGSFHFHNNTATQAIVGVDSSQQALLKDRLVVVEGSLDLSKPDAIVVSQATAAKLKARVGDTLVVELRTVTGQKNVGEFQLVAISRDPGMSASFTAFANRDTVDALENLPAGAYQTLGLVLADGADVGAAVDRLKAALATRVTLLKPVETDTSNPMGTMAKQHFQNPMGAMFQGLMKQAGDESWQGTRYKVTTIDDLLSQPNLSQIRAAIGAVSFLLLVLLFLVIVVGVANTFRLILFERIGEIGTLRALGVQRKGIRHLFLWEAFFLFLLGAAVGLVVAGLAMGALALVPFAPNSPAFLLLQNGHLSFVPSPVLIFEFVFVAAFVLLAALFPARQAARLNPAQALAAIR